MNVKELINAINNGDYNDNLKKVYVTDKAVESQKLRYTDALNSFAELYGAERDVCIMSAPGRTEICGNHTDHNTERFWLHQLILMLLQ